MENLHNGFKVDLRSEEKSCFFHGVRDDFTRERCFFHGVRDDFTRERPKAADVIREAVGRATISTHP